MPTKVTKSVTEIKNQHCNLLIYSADFDIYVAPTVSRILYNT